MEDLGLKVTSEGLKKLIIRKAYNITNNGFQSFFIKTLSSLQVLNLDECINIEDSTLEAIAESCRNLRKFSVSWCPKIFSSGTYSII